MTSPDQVLGTSFRVPRAVIWVFGRLRRKISCVAGSTLIRSCARNGIPSTASEFVSRATRRSVGFLEIQFFDGILTLALTFSLTSTPVG